MATTETLDFSCLSYDEHEHQHPCGFSVPNDGTILHLDSNCTSPDPNLNGRNTSKNISRNTNINTNIEATNSRIMVAPTNNNNGLIVHQNQNQNQRNMNITNSNSSNINYNYNNNNNCNGNICSSNSNSISCTNTNKNTSVDDHVDVDSDPDSESSSKQLELFLLKEKTNGSIVSTFKIYPLEATNDKLRDWIELAGGIVMEETEDSPYAIPILDLAYCKTHDVTSFQKLDHRDVFKSLFIYDCYTKEQLQDLNSYRASASTLVDYDANLILRRQLSWDEVFTACTSTVFQNCEDGEDDGQCEQNSSSSSNCREVQQEREQVPETVLADIPDIPAITNNDEDCVDEDDEEEEEEEDELDGTTDEESEQEQQEQKQEDEEEDQDPLAIPICLPNNIVTTDTGTGTSATVISSLVNTQNGQTQNMGSEAKRGKSGAEDARRPKTPPIKRIVHEIEFENDAIRRRKIPAFISPKRQPAASSSNVPSSRANSSSQAHGHAHAHANGVSSRTGFPNSNNLQRIPTPTPAARAPSVNREVPNPNPNPHLPPPPSSASFFSAPVPTHPPAVPVNDLVQKKGNSRGGPKSKSQPTSNSNSTATEPRVIIRRRSRGPRGPRTKPTTTNSTTAEGTENPNPKPKPRSRKPRQPKNNKDNLNPAGGEVPGTSTATETEAAPGKKVIRIRRVRKPKQKPEPQPPINAKANLPAISSPTTILPDGVNSSPCSQLQNTAYTAPVPPVADQNEDDEPGNLVIDIQPPVSRRKHVAYVWHESNTLLNYICQHNLHGEVRGNRIWKDIEQTGVIPNRTWLSLKEHFRRKVLESLVHYQCPPADQQKFAMLKKSQKRQLLKQLSPISPKSPKSPKAPSPAKPPSASPSSSTPPTTTSEQQDIYITADLPSSPELSPKQYTEFRTCTVALKDVRHMH